MPFNKTTLSTLILGIFLFPAMLLAQEAGSLIETVPAFSIPNSSPTTFAPYWTGQITGGYFSEGGNQRGSGFFLDGTRHLTAEGSFFATGAQGGTQQLEGSLAAWEGLSFSAGIGLGGWTPFFAVTAQKGDMNLSAMVVNVGGDIPLAPGFTSRLFLSGVVRSHDAPVASLLGLTNPSAEVDELNATIGLSLGLKIDSTLGLLWGFQQDMNQTAKIQNLTQTVSITPDVTDTLDTFKLGFDLNFSDHWIGEMVGEGGLDTMPAGSFYSDRLGQTVTLANASITYFMGGSASLKYRF